MKMNQAFVVLQKTCPSLLACLFPPTRLPTPALHLQVRVGTVTPTNTEIINEIHSLTPGTMSWSNVLGGCTRLMHAVRAVYVSPDVTCVSMVTG